MLVTVALFSLLSLNPSQPAPAVPTIGPAEIPQASIHDRSFDQTIAKVESMVWDSSVIEEAARHDLKVVNVSWEDTGRSKNSSVGPNISDMTIGVRDPQGKLHPMPVFRFDNFSDKTADIRTDKFYLHTGNERGKELKTTSLLHLLKDTREMLHSPRSWKGKQESLYNARDSHVLVSAQACFLPIPKNGEATFTPVIYNYQSSPGAPAVLTIVATREGTSIQVVENSSGYMSEVLFFNQDGERAPFTATRLSDFQRAGGDSTTSANNAKEGAGLDVVMVIQVPLKHKNMRRAAAPTSFQGIVSKSMAPMKEMEDSDVETAVIGHGPVEGPFKEINGLDIERDPRFPVRVTAQFYRATSNGQVTPKDIAAIKRQIDQVYSDGDYVGSLVTDGHTHRPTESATAPHGLWARPTWQWLKSN